ncbi:hypothetical protein RvY_11140 [Ramazzottius varieornatus]|uniref:EGF-like domain-containing protein n=1 Tax=Ramazzottius varieornatus TaxID=947166 RepID=A0A1D1VF52_RAMVA|nr:hypothetical protein RvY_11140 [Ramazzottius varieornatus]
MKQLVLLFVVITVVFARDISLTSRRKRQAVLENQLFPPQFFKSNGLILVSASSSDQARCQVIARGLAAPAGCFYVPLVRDTDGLAQNCQLQCPSIDIPFPLQSVGQLNSIVPDYLLNGQFNVIDNTINDRFVGDSFFLFTPATTTTIVPVAPTASAAVAITASTTTSTVAPGPGPVVVPPIVAPTPPTPDQVISACINIKGPPPTGCQYSGTGTVDANGVVTCGLDCIPPPFSGGCSATGSSRVVKCLCTNGPPGGGGANCAYLASGSNTPLVCPFTCAP